jgi:hypothetical protein
MLPGSRALSCRASALGRNEVALARCSWLKKQLSDLAKRAPKAQNHCVRFLDSLRLNPPFAEGTRRFGFRKWYERELIFSHLYLALAVLSLAAMLGAIEAFAQATPLMKLVDVACALISGVVLYGSIQGYLESLSNAESLANQTTCTECKTYGRIEALVTERSEDTVLVRCKRCDHRWRVEL